LINTIINTMEEKPFPSVPTPELPHFPAPPAHPCHREFPHAPLQQKKQLQEPPVEQRAQNELAKAFDQHIGFQNVRLACSGPDGDGGVRSIIDMAAETNVENLNIVSTGLTALDFDPCEQGHCVHARLCKGHRVAATVANANRQRGAAVAWRVEAKKGQGKPNQDVESFQRHGPNCLSHHCSFGGTRQPVTAAHLLPDALEDLHHVQTAFCPFKNRCPPVPMSALNVDRCSPAPDLRTRQVADFPAANGMEDMLPHFCSRRRFRHQKTWCRKRHNPDGTIQTML